MVLCCRPWMLPNCSDSSKHVVFCLPFLQIRASSNATSSNQSLDARAVESYDVVVAGLEFVWLHKTRGATLPCKLLCSGRSSIGTCPVMGAVPIKIPTSGRGKRELRRPFHARRRRASTSCHILPPPPHPPAKNKIKYVVKWTERLTLGNLEFTQ